ncbi:tRNA (adenosine(37)-N6)-dimethylallyltransferase MiaA [Candidatus Pelagibacter sp.]|uniref:tRNA (adenosine(37)-N6)-dimethylallyltransferase MiaA n=1 Tax=Candidatus Pelagibacter sp. TaxID=2024849 RepID=UPI003F83FD07
MNVSSKIILISGPTASGKSEFAIKLAKKINGEIINADSMQIYRELQILSARPQKKDYQKIKHHLYGFQNAKKNFSVGEWLKLAKKKIIEIKRRNKIPILVGGTGLYFKSLTDGLVKIPNVPLRIRNEIRLLNKNLGQDKFFKKLINLDPKMKSSINSSDVQRSIRAYEVKFFTKKSLNDWYRQTKTYFDKEDFIKIYLDYPREDLIKKISTRSKKMIKSGAIKEVKNFLKLKIKRDKPATRAIGIKEISDYLEKKLDNTQLIEKISIKTRQYAKRQVTWSRGHMSDWKRIHPKDIGSFLKKI